MTMSSDYEVKQLKVILQLIATARKNAFAINKLIIDSWTILEMLDLDRNWKKTFLNRINTIEQIYATAGTEKRTPNESELTTINDHLNKMEEQIKALLLLVI